MSFRCCIMSARMPMEVATRGESMRVVNERCFERIDSLNLLISLKYQGGMKRLIHFTKGVP